MSMIECMKKRKSVRKYDRNLTISEAELKEIKHQLTLLKPLVPEIRVEYRIVRSEEVNSMGEYCLLMYSEEKEHDLMNAGYLLEQMDLYFASKCIGACWYGMGKSEEKQWNGLRFVIMMAFGKCTEADFRTSTAEFNRISYEKAVQGSNFRSVLETSLLAPSAVNSQPWRIVCDESEIRVFRTTNIMLKFAKIMVDYFNKIDMGIYLCFLEQALHHEHIEFERQLLSEQNAQKMKPVAVYRIKKEGIAC